MRLLQQTLRTSQCDRQPVHRPDPVPDSSSTSNQTEGSAVTQGAIAQLEALLQERDGQIQSLCGHMERLALEKDSLQQELKGLKIKVGEINDQLGMLMETIQAKDEVIIKLSQQSTEQRGNPNDAGSPTPNKDQQELDILKVQKETRKPDLCLIEIRKQQILRIGNTYSPSIFTLINWMCFSNFRTVFKATSPRTSS